MFIVGVSRESGSLKDIVEISNIVRIWQYNQLESCRRLEAILLVILLFLRNQSAESDSRVLSRNKSDNSNPILSYHLFD